MNGTILITGGTSGIGRGTALVCASAGLDVIILGRRRKLGEDVVRDIEASGRRALFVAGSVESEADVASAVDIAVQTFGRLDFAFNNAGVSCDGLLTELSGDDFDRCFAVNARGVWLSMKYELRAMTAQGGGAIVNNASVHARRTVFSGIGGYVASKHAVVALTQAAALEAAASSIRVNAVAPGPIMTEMLECSDGVGGADAWRELVPSRRLGRVDEVAAAVMFLLSDRASYISGQTLAIDGGFLAA